MAQDYIFLPKCRNFAISSHTARQFNGRSLQLTYCDMCCVILSFTKKTFNAHLMTFSRSKRYRAITQRNTKCNLPKAQN